MFDVIGGDILARSAALVRAGGTLVTVAEPPKTQPHDGRAVFFVVEADRAQLAALAARVRDGRLTPAVGAVLPLAEAAAALLPQAHPWQDDPARSRRLKRNLDDRTAPTRAYVRYWEAMYQCADPPARTRRPSPPLTGVQRQRRRTTAHLLSAVGDDQGVEPRVRWQRPTPTT